VELGWCAAQPAAAEEDDGRALVGGVPRRRLFNVELQFVVGWPKSSSSLSNCSAGAPGLICPFSSASLF